MKGRHFFCRCSIYFAVSVLMVFGLSEAIFAQSGWATVDTRILLMFHPQMSGFDYSNGRFFRQIERDRNFDKVINELKSAKEKAGKEIKPLDEERLKLVKSRVSYMQELSKSKTGFAPGELEKLKKEKTTLEAATQELNRQKPASRDAERLIAARKVDLRDRLAIISARVAGEGAQDNGGSEKKIHEKIADIDKQLLELQKKRLVLEENAMSAVYLTSDETEKRLKVISDEINSLVQQAAREMKTDVVMDTSFAMRAQSRKDKMKMIPAVDESPDVVSSSLFHSFDNLTIDPQLQATLTGPEGSPLPPEHLVVGRAIGMQSNLTQYLEFRNYMPEKVSGFSTGRLFLSGGTDLTSWVARKLFDRYKVPDSVKNSFMITLRRYLDFDKDPVNRERDY